MNGRKNAGKDAIGRRALLTGAWRRPPPAPPPVRPPGAVAAVRFDALCDGCGDCAAICPADAIVMTGPATAQSETSPEIEAAISPCVMCAGLVCAPACPVGALEAVLPETMRVATISFDSEACWAAAGLDPGCDYCFDRCPLKGRAITWRRGAGPEIHQEACTGCGVCVHYCPATPKPLAADGLRLTR